MSCFLEKLLILSKSYIISIIKRKNKQDPSKPWLTPGVIKSIRIKNNLSKQFCQANNLGQRVILHQKFKNYKNQIVTLNCLCKKDYFKAYFETNKKDLKKIWFGIKTLIYTKIPKNVSQKLTLNIDNKTVSDDHIADHFNSFFTSIAGKLHKKIPKA